MDGLLVYLPNEVSKVSRFGVRHAAGEADCGFATFTALFDRNGDLLVASVDDFLAAAVVDQLVAAASRPRPPATWAWAHIHPDARDMANLRKGNGFPGLRVDADKAVTAMVTRCLTPVMAIVDPTFSFQGLKDTQTLSVSQSV
jgi:hypothetical protein